MRLDAKARELLLVRQRVERLLTVRQKSLLSLDELRRRIPLSPTPLAAASMASLLIPSSSLLCVVGKEAFSLLSPHR